MEDGAFRISKVLFQSALALIENVDMLTKIATNNFSDFEGRSIPTLFYSAV